jgi:phosphopantothenoylcysteine decarboxylase
VTASTDHAAPRVLYLVVSAAPPAQRIGELVSAIMDLGWTVCVIPTPRAAGWLDSAALAEQTGHPVRHEHRRSGDGRALPGASAVAVVPATFNTINKWSAGTSDNFALGILNEAVGLRLPVLVVPYAKPSLAAHPAFSDSLARLSRWGIRLLPNEIIRGDHPSGIGFNWRPVITAMTNL